MEFSDYVRRDAPSSVSDVERGRCVSSVQLLGSSIGSPGTSPAAVSKHERGVRAGAKTGRRSPAAVQRARWRNSHD